MKPEELVRQYLPLINVMQLATVADDQPYQCTVHYYSDNDLNLYWCSLPSRRHSQEIERNSNVSVYVLVHENTPDEDYVIGMSLSGHAEIVQELDDQVANAYIKKLLKDPSLPADIKQGTSPHRFYRFKSSSIVLFDTKNFPKDPRQEIIIN